MFNAKTVRRFDLLGRLNMGTCYMWRGCVPRVKYLLFLMSLITTFLVGRDLISAKLAAWKAKYKAFVILSRADFIDIFQSVELLILHSRSEYSYHWSSGTKAPRTRFEHSLFGPLCVVRCTLY